MNQEKLKPWGGKATDKQSWDTHLSMYDLEVETELINTKRKDWCI